MNSVDQLATAIHNLGARQLVVVTGAGISLASGIPTFRGSDPDAVWSKDVMEMGTNRFFMENPGESWAWYLSRFDNLSDKEPNDAHTALVELERWHTARGGRFLLVTQNVDTLHRKAGSERLVEVHGRSDEVRCSQFGCELAAPFGSMARVDLDLDTFRTDPSDANIAPRVPLFVSNAAEFINCEFRAPRCINCAFKTSFSMSSCPGTSPSKARSFFRSPSLPTTPRSAV